MENIKDFLYFKSFVYQLLFTLHGFTLKSYFNLQIPDTVTNTLTTQRAFACSNSTIKTKEGVNCVKNKQ